ncbi:hypothetical protein AVEN_71994-1 [Araneus ventricosus]|uniref:Uncharacterized protein n=1 Tax=Araneus ventricosus TaxID=182803 RepID=A0A4Y2DFT5_ARAVE|nr:hypothetical protein AVEN_71994-1 [Araneus ventricosus]
MATTEVIEIKALISDSSKVVSAAKAKMKKNRLSRKTKDKFEKLGPVGLDDSLVQKKKDFLRTVEKPLVTNWGTSLPPGPSPVGMSVSLVPYTEPALTELTVERPPEVIGYISSQSEYCSDDLMSDTDSILAADASALASDPNVDIPGTLTFQQDGKIRQFYLKGKLVPQPTFALHPTEK